MVNYYFPLLFALLFLVSGGRTNPEGNLIRSRSIAAVKVYNDLNVLTDTDLINKPFVIIGDTQSTGIFERIFLRRESNDIYRKHLIDEMAKNRPAFIVHLGDLIEVGTSYSDWNAFDHLFTDNELNGVPLLPVFGNHDYWRFNKTRALSNMITRFPWMTEHWYSRQVGPLLMVWLDTNIGELSKSEWITQIAWYNKKLAEAEKDKSIKGIFVFVHHPPFTNSKVTGDEAHVQKAFLPAFFHSKKSLALFAGHAHGYEHFKKEGRDFIVSGGGGGPRVKLKVETKARHQDLFSGPSPRPFNYLYVRPNESGFRIEVKGFQKGEAHHLIDQFDLLYAQ